MAKDKFNPEEWLNQPAPSSHARPDRASDDIETITARIESSHTDITAGYDNWRDLGFALSEELGETGRDYFHRISRFNPDYDQAETDKQYDRCLRAHGTGVTIKTFFQKAKEAGISIGLFAYRSRGLETFVFFPRQILRTPRFFLRRKSLHL